MDLYPLLSAAQTSRHVTVTKAQEALCKPKPVSKASLAGLPPEIHLLISRQLTYPDALSLKHTSRYFFHLVDTGVKLKVAWLMERRSLRLALPNDRRCDLRSDLKFCRGSVKYVSGPSQYHLHSGKIIQLTPHSGC
jgi:hypothetical protein